MKRFAHSLTPVLSISGPGDSLANSDQAVEDGETVVVRSTRQVFQYENPSTAVVDGVTVVQSNFGAGKWILMTAGGGGGSSFAEFYNTASAGAAGSGRLVDATLVVLGALTDGDKVWVRSVQDSYTWNVASVAASDGVVTVNPTANIGNPGRFIRDRIASPLWQARASWYIDPLNPNASDENDGSAGLTPLRTAGELRRRLNGRLIQQNTTINIQGNIANTDPFIVDFGAIPTATVTVVGNVGPTVAGSGYQIASFVARGTAVSPGIPNAMVAMIPGGPPTILDATPYTPAVDGGYIIRVNDGASAGAGSYALYYDAPGAVGRLTATANYFTSFWNPTTRVEANPAPGDHVQIQICPKIGCYSIAPTGGTWVFQSIYFNQVGSDRAALTTYRPSNIDCLEPSVTMLFKECSFDKLNPTTNGMTFENCLAIDTAPTFAGCKVLWKAGLLWGLTLGAGGRSNVIVDDANVSFTVGAIAYLLCHTTQNGGDCNATDYAIFPSGMVMAAGFNATLVVSGQSRMNIGTLWAGVQPPPFGLHGMTMEPGCVVTYNNKPMLNRGLGSGRELAFVGTELIWSSIPTLSGWVEPQNGTEIVPAGGAYDWTTQAAWFVDPANVAAADENSGLTNLVPLKTDRERDRRWGGGKTGQPVILRQATTVTYNSTVPDSDATVYNVLLGVGGALSILGAMTVTKSGTFAAVTAMNRGAQTPWSATSVAAFDGTEVGKFIQDTTAGANMGKWASAVKFTGGSLRLSPPGIANVAAFSFDIGAFSNGDTYDVLTPTTVAVGLWSFADGTNRAASAATAVIIDGMKLKGAAPSTIRCINSFVNVKRVTLSGISLISSAGVVWRFYGSMFDGSVGFNNIIAGAVELDGCAMLASGGFAVNSGAFLITDKDTIFQNHALYVSNGATWWCGTTAAFDNGSTGGIDISIGATCTSQSLGGGDLLWGTGNTGYAIKVHSGCVFTYTTKPTINATLGAGRETLVGATDKQWGSIPFADTGATGTQAAIVPYL